MAIITVTLAFSSNDGEAEKFTGATTYYTDGIYDSAEGNPNGSVRFDAGNNLNNNLTSKYWPEPFATQQTFEDFGVPAFSTINTINNFVADGAHFNFGTGNTTHQIILWLRVENITCRVRALPALVSGDTAWTALTLNSTNETPFPAASTDHLAIVARLWSNTGVAGTSSTHFDNISFDIDYTETVSIGSGALDAQQSLVSGYAYALPSTHEIASENTLDNYILYADGVSVPLIQFTVRRNTAAETAAITAPVDFEDIIAAATVISIDIVSTDVYGTETTTEIFTGALADYSTSRSGIISNCTGAASWPANAVRDFGNVSYITDDANYNAYRLSIDPRFYPGDVGMYGLRRININRVTFSVNQNQSFMELSSVGQV